MPKCPLWANTRRKNTTRQCVKWVDVRASQQLTKSNAPTKENMLGTQEPSSEFSDVTTRLNKALLLVDESSVRQRSNSARIVQGFDPLLQALDPKSQTVRFLLETVLLQVALHNKKFFFALQPLDFLVLQTYRIRLRLDCVLQLSVFHRLQRCFELLLQLISRAPRGPKRRLELLSVPRLSTRLQAQQLWLHAFLLLLRLHFARLHARGLRLHHHARRLRLRH